MTDRERLLIALLSEPDERPARGVSAVEIVAMLHELGDDYRRMWRDIDLTVGV